MDSNSTVWVQAETEDLFLCASPLQRGCKKRRETQADYGTSATPGPFSIHQAVTQQPSSLPWALIQQSIYLDLASSAEVQVPIHNYRDHKPRRHRCAIALAVLF